MFKKAGRPYLLDSNLMKNVEDIAFRTRAARGAINRRQILNIGKGVVKDKNSSSLKESGGTIELTDRWARDLLDSMESDKRKETTGKTEPFLSEGIEQFLSEEKFASQRVISAAVLEHEIPTS